MKKSMSSFLKRILAVALAMFMVFTSMPLPVVAYAETGEEQGGETVTKHKVSVSVKNGLADVTVAGNSIELKENEDEDDSSLMEETVEVDAAESVAYTIAPKENYYIIDILINEESIGAEKLSSIEKGQAYTTGSFKLDKDTNISVELGRYWNVTVSELTLSNEDNADGGTVSLKLADEDETTEDALVVDDQSVVTVSILPDEGYQILNATLKEGDTEAHEIIEFSETGFEFSHTVTENTTIEVEFVKVHTITVTYDGNGTVVTTPEFTPNDETNGGSVVVKENDVNKTVTITATPNANYRVSSVTINEVEDEFEKVNGYDGYKYEKSLSADKDYTIVVTFALNQYKVTATESENGSVEVKNGVVDHDEDATVWVTPDAGYLIETITVADADRQNPTNIAVDSITEALDESENAIKGTFTFTIGNVTSDKNVTVTFISAEEASNTDYTVDDSLSLRKIENTFIISENGRIEFTTEKDGIRIYKQGETEKELLAENDSSIAIEEDAEIVEIQLYYKDEGETHATWHTVAGITDAPIKVVVDKTPASIGTEVITPDATEYGYYNSDVTIDVTVTDDSEYYSGIQSIDYFITKTEIADDTKYADALQNSGEQAKNLYSYLEDLNDIQQSVTLSDLDKKILVSAEDYNSKDTKVWIKVTDRAGNSSEKVIPLKINSTPPEVSFIYSGDKCKDERGIDVSGAYYANRTLTITVVDREDTFDEELFKEAVKAIITKDGNNITFDETNIVWKETENSSVDIKEYEITFWVEGKYAIDIDAFSFSNKAGTTETSISIPEDTVDCEEFAVDTGVPSVIITYPDDVKAPFDDRYYKDNVEVTLAASDSVSGIKEIRWKYIKSENVSNVNEVSDEEWNVITYTDSSLTKEEKICIPKSSDDKKQYHGYIEVQVVDNAGHVFSVLGKENGEVFIVDNKLPIGSVVYTQNINLIGTQKIYNKADSEGKIDFTINIEEANFASKDVHVFVSKNGAEKIEVVPEWIDETIDLHTGTYTIQGDGDYIFSIEYTDKSGNEMVKYTTELLTIDTIIPKLGFNFVKSDSSQTMTFTVTEHNFRAQDISLSGSITDINGNAIENFSVAKLENMLRTANWAPMGNDVYTCSFDSCPDGIYNLSIDYKDIALQDAATVNTGKFIIDHTAPTNIKIDYSKSILDTILETITLGFYKGDVTVTFTAYDNTSGVDYLTWNYTKQNGASDVNRSTDEVATTVAAVQDASDKSKFTAKVTLPNTDEKQLRGYLAAYATDTYANVGTKVTDSGYIIVVDSIAPTMTAEYSVADRMVGKTSYYNDTAEVIFTVTEANFFAEDVVVTVSKDGGTAYAITPKWTDVTEDTHVGTYTLTGDGDYVITVNYTDRSTNKMATYVSDTITIDTIQPVIEVVYQNTNVINILKDRDSMDREYFADTQTAVITITEHNFNAEDVVFNIKATDVTGKELDVNNLHMKSAWEAGEKADTHVLTITYQGDANYTFDVEYADLATNRIADYATDYFTVDNTAPVELALTYSTSILETILETISFGFYNAKADVTLTANDAVSGVHGFMYSYENADGVSAVNAELINQEISSSEIEYSNGGLTATVKFQIPKDVLTASDQFNGTISFEATDRAGLKNTLKDNKRIVVDNIAPTAQVTYNEPVNKEGTISYYDGNVDATIIVTEANFYATDVVVSVTKDDGTPYVITPAWTDDSVDTHTGTFTLDEDGDYFITITYLDKSSNEMAAYTSEQLTIDTDIQEPTITFNGNNEDRMAYKGEVVPEISFTDVNYDSFEIFLYRTYIDEIDVDITEEKGINNLFSVTEETGSASLNVFDLGEDGKYDPNDDGIYRLLVTMQDKAGHNIEKEAYFTINRYGSVYAFDEYLVDLIANGGAFVNEVTEDLIITEYNADRLVEDSLDIEITRDGKPLEDVEYTVSPVINDSVSVGSSGWYQYEYVISKDNFVLDGIYKISISSTDATGNNPENSNFEDKNIIFYVDSTVPEITSITGLEKSVVDATELTISYTVFDAIGLKSIKVYVDDEMLQDITDFSADFNNYAGSFTLEESEKERDIRIVVEDMAGNITDTASEEFTSAYAFNDSVTVTTNALVRFYANKPVFYGTIGGTAAVAGLAGFGIRRFRLRKKI